MDGRTVAQSSLCKPTAHDEDGIDALELQKRQQRQHLSEAQDLDIFPSFLWRELPQHSEPTAASSAVRQRCPRQPQVVTSPASSSTKLTELC
jgi:hypothetical protein